MNHVWLDFCVCVWVFFSHQKSWFKKSEILISTLLGMNLVISMHKIPTRPELRKPQLEYWLRASFEDKDNCVLLLHFSVAMKSTINCALSFFIFCLVCISPQVYTRIIKRITYFAQQVDDRYHRVFRTHWSVINKINEMLW